MSSFLAVWLFYTCCELDRKARKCESQHIKTGIKDYFLLIFSDAAQTSINFSVMRNLVSSRLGRTYAKDLQITGMMINIW